MEKKKIVWFYKVIKIGGDVLSEATGFIELSQGLALPVRFLLSCNEKENNNFNIKL